MHTIVAVGESEVDVSSAEFYRFNLALRLIVGTDNRRVIHGLSALAFQHAALYPNLERARQNGHVVQQYGVVAHIGEEQKPGNGVEQGFQGGVETFQLVQFHMLRFLAIYKVNEVVVLLLWNVEQLCHRLEQHIRMIGLETSMTELHQSQQQQVFFYFADIALQIRTDRCNGVHCVQIFRHLVGHTHVGVKVHVQVCISDSEMAMQIAYEHILSSYLIHLLFFAKQSKQTDKT